MAQVFRVSKLASKSNPATQLPASWNIKHLLPWLLSWEIYLVLLIAGFLRLYQITTSEFDGDQAAIFDLAREALHFGLWPIVSNRASIGIQNPPAVIYLLMIPAALSADPLWATVMVGLWNTLAVLLTYLFTRRYYGRLAGITAALLYAVAAKPLNYSRFIWQQNMLAPVVVLFMFALFWGVVERRKGWLFPAVFLLGVAYQLHETSLLLLIPLLIAVVLAPGTLRWRDVALALVSLLIIFSPYILWEFSSKFSDVSIVLNLAKLRAHVDTTVIYLYEFFLSPNGFDFYDQVPASPTSALHLFGPVLYWLRYLVWLLVAGGLVTAGTLALWPLRGNAPGRGMPIFFFRNWWTNFRASPYRCGLMLLLIWQIVPVLILLRHTVALFPYYLLVFMPGPFILMGILVAQVVKLTQQHEGVRNYFMLALRYGIYAVAAFAIIAQLLTCVAALIDKADGNYLHGIKFNDLGSLQHALNEADQLAQQRHLNRVYITTDVYSQIAMGYLAEQMRTPTTLFDDASCLVLPGASDGPAVFLVGPYAQLTLALLNQFATTTLIDTPARLGAPPFRLYIVTPRPVTGQTFAPETFVSNLQLLNLQRQQLDVAGSSWLVSRWNLLRSALPGPRITYNYAMTAVPNMHNNSPSHSHCILSAMRTGDQLLIAFALPEDSSSPSFVTIEGQAYTTTPSYPSLGPLRLETDQTQDTPRIVLRTMAGKDKITISIS